MDYKVIDSIKCYAPELAYTNESFPKEAFEELYKLEEKHFWFISRNKVIEYLFGKFSGQGPVKVLEIGCGTGFVLKGLSEKFPLYEIQGSEIYLSAITFAKKRLPNVEFVQLDATRMPFREQFDAIGAFDVLEHIEADEKVIQGINLALKLGGLFYVTVPQYNWMWSLSDDIAYHKRRYSRQELQQKLKKGGFDILYIGSFVFILFPFMLLSRLLYRNKSQVSTPKTTSNIEFSMPPLLNNLFLYLMKIDEWLIHRGFSLPVGGSLIAVAKKK